MRGCHILAIGRARPPPGSKPFGSISPAAGEGPCRAHFRLEITAGWTMQAPVLADRKVNRAT
jgi:hypothetical protein